MRALEHAAQVTQLHLNRRRFFHLFTETHSTGSSCLVRFQIISKHAYAGAEQFRSTLKAIHDRFRAQNPLTSPRPSR